MLLNILSALLLVFAASLPAQASENCVGASLPLERGDCPEGYYQLYDTCYYTDANMKLNWAQAFDDCINRGGRLVWVESVDEKCRLGLFLDTVLGVRGDLVDIHVYVGGKRVGSKKRDMNWINPDGSAGPQIHSSVFHFGQPDNFFWGEPVADFWHPLFGDWAMNDFGDNHQLNYVCEAPVDASNREDCGDAAALQAEIAALQAELAAKNAALNQAQQDLADSEAENQRLQNELDDALAGGQEPIMPTASPTATLSDTAYKFTLDLNGIEYILETTSMQIALESDDFCEEFGMKLAQIEDQETLDAIGLQLAAIQNQGVSLTEVATGERSSVNLDKDIYPEDFNAAGWNCATIVPDGSGFKMVGKKCQGERAVLCAAVPLYC